ncbi:unnamed protein product [Caenorhabditis sp. 36 PRJEB53466]|nr:unnamed protein product [Caenorhabditis sp. 36 PRJEB53466]
MYQEIFVTASESVFDYLKGLTAPVRPRNVFAVIELHHFNDDDYPDIWMLPKKTDSDEKPEKPRPPPRGDSKLTTVQHTDNALKNKTSEPAMSLSRMSKS